MGPEDGPVTPVLLGRWQTRWFLLLTAGLAWQIVFTPVLLLFAGGASLADLYKVTLLALLVTGLVGFVTEAIYHLLMQFRWEKDWPAMFILLEGIPEGFLVFWILQQLVGFDIPVLAYAIDFATVWLVVFFAAHGPMRIPFLRWRYRGGRIV
jgi:hypothetical protein